MQRHARTRARHAARAPSSLIPRTSPSQANALTSAGPRARQLSRETLSINGEPPLRLPCTAGTPCGEAAAAAETCERLCVCVCAASRSPTALVSKLPIDLVGFARGVVHVILYLSLFYLFFIGLFFCSRPIPYTARLRRGSPQTESFGRRPAPAGPAHRFLALRCAALPNPFLFLALFSQFFSPLLLNCPPVSASFRALSVSKPLHSGA